MKICKNCGAHLDPGERCDCEAEIAESVSAHVVGVFYRQYREQNGIDVLPKSINLFQYLQQE